MQWHEKRLKIVYLAAVAALLFAAVSAPIFTALVDTIAAGSTIAVIIVTVASILAVYSDVPRACAALACNGNVKECGIVWKTDKNACAGNISIFCR